MMRKPSKFISELSDNERNELEFVIKNSNDKRFRQRAQAIIISSKGFSMNEIAKICEVDRETISSWFDKWEKLGLEGLKDKARSGHPGILSPSEKQLVIELCQQTPRSIPTIIATLFDQTNKRVSGSTIKRLLKQAGLRWKRIKKTMRNKRDEVEFRAAQSELKEFRKQHQEGEIELWYFDESGFNLQPCVPYAWQPVGQTIEIPSTHSKRLNVLGFLTPDNQLESFCFEGLVDTDVVVACFDRFARRKASKPRIVIRDNAPIHTNPEFLVHLSDWEKKGVLVLYLPTYSSELNLIERLWRFLKYYWLPFSAYLSFQHLVDAVQNILRQIGSEYFIHFSN